MFRDVVTTLLEVFGLAAVSVGGGLAVAQWSPAAGVAAAGLGLIGSSVLIERPWHVEAPIARTNDEAFL